MAADENDFVTGYTMSKIYERGGEGIMARQKAMYIDDVCVDKEFRRSGIGKKLMNATVKEAEKAGCQIAELNVWAFNEQAIKFYESCGLTKQRQYMEVVLK
ncbi:MAG: GNAT family N-acetyltransferase [Clostridiales bacterium]|nr:GNAT family N-acetyltransferase [Clostridiales bacterium]